MKKLTLFIAGILIMSMLILPVLPAEGQRNENRYWHSLGVRIHAAGTAVTSDLSDYHFVTIHGIALKVVPIETAEQIKDGSVTCTGRTCVTDYGISKTYGVMKFGTTVYKIIGDFSEDESIFEGDIYTTDYNLRCLAGGECDSAMVGTLSYTINEQYENTGHSAVGTIEFTDGEYAGNTYLSVVKNSQRRAAISVSNA